MRKNLKDIILISMIVVIGFILFLVMRQTKEEGAVANVYYKNINYATIDFNQNKVIINKDIINNEGYPKVILEYDNLVELVLVGDYKIDNKQTFVYVEIDFDMKKVRIRKDDSPYQIAVKRGWYDGTGLPLISAPNSISIIFEKSDVDFAI